MDSKLKKHFQILQWFEYFSVEFISQVDFAFRTVVKAEPKRMTGDMAGVYDVRQHFGHSKGSIRGSGLLARASCQA